MDRREEHPKASNQRLIAATIAALGIVYGDIGTSPLYAVRECFAGESRLAINEVNVLGVMSLILWALILVVSIKYLVFVMRADHHGEGGILALMAVARRGSNEQAATRLQMIVLMGLFGAGLLYGDGVITPAISVLSAVEGLHVATSAFDRFVVPITIAILCGLFWIQRRGTAKVARWFGPVMLVWFAVIALLGIAAIAKHPQILAAISPHYAVAFFSHNGLTGVAILGVVFLVVTGGEALYADMGHFGAKPIRMAWFTLVLPSLLLNYFGQGALLLANPDAVRNPFYLLAPSWALYPLVVLSTVATVIASQAVISGAFSLTSQAVQLGYLPRLTIQHTSVGERGQVYVPAVNWMLFAAVIAIVLAFRTSSRLAGAYGMAVTTTMVITTLLLFVVARRRWGWTLWISGPLMGAFLIVDLAFFAANVPKIPDGGWFPLLVGFGICFATTTWRRGRRIVAEEKKHKQVSATDFLKEIGEMRPVRISPSAVYLTSHPDQIPPALLHNLRHNQVLHHDVAILTVVIEERPWVNLDDRVQSESLGHGITRIIARYGYMQRLSVPQVLEQCKHFGVDFTRSDTMFFLGRTSLDITNRPGMSYLRKLVFNVMSKTADDPSTHFQIPPDQVVEIGGRIHL